MLGQIARDLVLRVPEAPAAGASAAVRSRREMLGGKGANQAVGLAQLGVPVALVGVVGADRTGTDLVATADNDGIDVSAVVRRTGTPTALIVDVVDDQAHWHYLEHIPDEVLLAERDVFAASERIRAASMVVIQLQQPAGAALEAARLAHAAGSGVVLDGAPGDAAILPELLREADVLRADAREAEQLAGRRIDSVDAAANAATGLLGESLSLVVLEVAGEGDLFAWPDGYEFIPHLPSAVVDTTGAGDALVATLTRALARGVPVRVAARRAVAAAASTTEHAGGRPRLS